MTDNTQSEVDIINQEISQLKGILNRQNNDEFKSLTAAEPTQGDFCHQSTATCSLNTTSTTDTSVVELSEKIDNEDKVSQENIFSAVDESELVVDEEEAGGLEECLKFNQNYQILIKQQLLKVQHALAQNRERQAEIKDDYNIAYISKKRPKRERSLLSFCQSYFIGDLGQGPPPSEETIRRHAGKEPSAHIIPALKWQKPQLERLTAGVQSDGMEQKMQPILNRREVLMRKLKSLKNEEEEKDELKKTIQEIDDELDRIKNLPDREHVGDRLRQVDFTKISIMDLEGTRSAFECQVQWQNYQHPDINKTDWSSQEIQSLANAVNTYGEYDWDTVAEEIGGGRLPWQCLDAYQREIPQESDNVKFTEEEDALLLKLVDSFRIGDFIPFQKVAFFMNRLRRQVVARWNTRLDPNLKLGPWTAAEDQLLKEGIKQFGNSWMKIADRIKGRHPVSIRERWLTSLNPQRKSGKWSLEEDISLLEMRLEYGKGNWRLMTEQLAKRTNSKHERAMNGLVIRQRLLEVQINRFKNKIEENAEGDEVKVEIKEEDGSLSKEMCEWMRKYINHLKKKLVGKKQIMQLIEENKWDQVPNANKLREWFRRSEIEQICKDRNKEGKPHVLRRRRPKKRKYSSTESENSSQSEDEDEEDDFEDEEEKDAGEQLSKPKTSRKVGRPKGTLMDTIVAAQIKHLLKQYAGFVTRDRQMKISKAQETLSKIPELKVKQSSLSVYIALLKVFQVDMNTTSSYIRHITNRRKALTLSDKDSPKKTVSNTENREVPDTSIAAPVMSLSSVQTRSPSVQSPQFSLNTHLSTAAFQMGMVPATWLLPGQTVQPDGNLSQHSMQLPSFQAPMSQVPMSPATQRLPTLGQTTQPAGNLSQHSSTPLLRFQALMSQVPMSPASQRLPTLGKTTQPAGNLSQHSTQLPRFQAPMSQVPMSLATERLPTLGQTAQPAGNFSQHSTQLPRFQAPMSQVPMSPATQRLTTPGQTTQPAGNLSQHSTQLPRFQSQMSPMSQAPMSPATQRLQAPGQTTQPARNMSQHNLYNMQLLSPQHNSTASQTQFRLPGVVNMQGQMRQLNQNLLQTLPLNVIQRFAALRNLNIQTPNAATSNPQQKALVTSNCPAVTSISRTVGCTSSSTSETSTLTSTAPRLTTTASQILTEGAQPREETQDISSGSSAAISTMMNPLPTTIVTSHAQGHQTNTSPLPAKSIGLSSVQLPNLPGTNLVQNILPDMNQFQPQGSQLFQTLMPNILAQGLLPTNPGNILQTSGVINIPGKGFLVPVQNFCSVPQMGSTQSAVINPSTRPIAQSGTPSYVPTTTSAAIPNSLNVSSPPAVSSTPVTTKNVAPIAGNATKSVTINLPYYERSLKKMSRKITTVPDEGREFSHEMLLIASLPEVEKVSETKYIVPTRYFKLFDSGDMDLLLARKTFIADKDNNSGPNTNQVQTNLPETSSTKQSCSAKSTNQSVSSDYHESLVRLIFRSPKYDEDNISFACDDLGSQYFITCVKEKNDSRKCSWVKIDVRPMTIADHGKINAFVYKPGTLRKNPFTVVIPDLGKYNVYENISSVMVDSSIACSMLQKQRQKQQKQLPYLSPNPERISDFLANHDRPGAKKKRPRPELVVSQSQIFSSDEISKANSLIFRILGNNPSSMQLLPPNLANVKALISFRSHRKELINQTKGCIIPKHVHHRLKDANANVLGNTSTETETTDSECDSQNVKDALHVIRKTPEYKLFNARFRSLFAWPTMLSKIEKTG
ncbi:uncharacterized protein [Antedon mediterranea]|uniref:uncharacterized protein n=1 Tax=Antedon mediterranea TaxID=105859 RepID=UPI003AF9F23F